MGSDIAFAATNATTPARSAGNAGEPLAVAGGVQWLGIPPGERHRRDRDPGGERVGCTAVLGSAHGPRLLELVRAAG